MEWAVGGGVCAWCLGGMAGLMGVTTRCRRGRFSLPKLGLAEAVGSVEVCCLYAFCSAAALPVLCGGSALLSRSGATVARSTLLAEAKVGLMRLADGSG